MIFQTVEEEEKPQLARSTFYQRTRTDQILRELFAKFPPPDDVVWVLCFNVSPVFWIYY